MLSHKCGGDVLTPAINSFLCKFQAQSIVTIKEIITQINKSGVGEAIGLLDNRLL